MFLIYPNRKPLNRFVTHLHKTIKKLRGFLGAIKQLSPCIENYATILSSLEKIAAGRGSAENVVWTEQLLKDFDKAKHSLQNIRTVYLPRPNDILHTYSDWSQAHGAVGGRLEVHRVQIVVAHPQHHHARDHDGAFHNHTDHQNAQHHEDFYPEHDLARSPR